MQSCRELVVWQKSYALTLDVYRATDSFPRREIFGLTSQVRRAAVSIPANIAEGYCRQTRPDYLRFLSFAQGSAGELGTLLSLAHDLTYLDDRTSQHLMEQLDDVGMMLTRLVQALRRPTGKPVSPRPERESLRPKPDTRNPIPETLGG